MLTKESLEKMTDKQLMKALGDSFLDIAHRCCEDDRYSIINALINAARIQDEIDRRLCE